MTYLDENHILLLLFIKVKMREINFMNEFFNLLRFQKQDIKFLCEFSRPLFGLSKITDFLIFLFHF